MIVDLTEEELEALADFFPRVSVANIVTEGSPLHTALLKIASQSLPTSLKYDKQGRSRNV